MERESREDGIAKRLIQGFESEGELERVEAHPEAHYNYYGDRGVADLYVRLAYYVKGISRFYDGHVIEIKSDSAVRSATGANEILRQYNKMRKFFFKSGDWQKPVDRVEFRLIFEATPYTISHVLDNKSLYLSAADEELWHSRRHTVWNPIEFIGSEGTRTVRLGPLREGVQNWLAYCEQVNPEIAELAKEADAVVQSGVLSDDAMGTEGGVDVE